MYGLGGRAVVALIAILAVGLVALPSTVSLFAGQHYWYNINKTGNQIPCEKCHADVFEELNQSKFHIGFGNGDENKADREDCAACHRGYESITYASDNGTNWVAGKEAHAASVVACMMCHDWTNYSTWSAPAAGGFDPTLNGKYSYSNEYNYGSNNGTYEAHNAFIVQALKSNTLRDSNEACIACHTHVAVKIKWNHSRSLEFNVGFGNPITTNNGPHNWTITGWSINGTAEATVWGNTTGNGSTSYNGVDWPGTITNVSYTYN